MWLMQRPVPPPTRWLMRWRLIQYLMQQLMRRLMWRRLVRGLRLRLRRMRLVADEDGCCEWLWPAADAVNAAGVMASAAAEAAADTAVVIYLRVLLHTSTRYPLFSA